MAAATARFSVCVCVCVDTHTGSVYKLPAFSSATSLPSVGVNP